MRHNAFRAGLLVGLALTVGGSTATAGLFRRERAAERVGFVLEEGRLDRAGELFERIGGHRRA